MKHRKGFVSNSSSSSFLIAIEKTEFDKVLGRFSEEDRHIILNWYDSMSSFFGTEAYYHFELSVQGMSNYDDEVSWDDRAVIKKFEKEIPADKRVSMWADG